jgi:hypothetical protein
VAPISTRERWSGDNVACRQHSLARPYSGQLADESVTNSLMRSVDATGVSSLYPRSPALLLQLHPSYLSVPSAEDKTLSRGLWNNFRYLGDCPGEGTKQD